MIEWFVWAQVVLAAGAGVSAVVFAILGKTPNGVRSTLLPEHQAAMSPLRTENSLFFNVSLKRKDHEK